MNSKLSKYTSLKAKPAFNLLKTGRGLSQEKL